VNEPQDSKTWTLVEGWPAEAGNGDLARFATEVRAGRPALSEEAMGRVLAAMRREMDAPAAPAGFWGRVSGWGWPLHRAVLVGVLALGIVVYATVFRKGGGTRVEKGGPPAPAGEVVDRYRVNYSGSGGEAPQRPLVRPEDYSSLTGVGHGKMQEEK